jgi:hypothetical protein
MTTDGEGHQTEANWGGPNRNNFSRSIVPTSNGAANGQTRRRHNSADRHAAGT